MWIVYKTTNVVNKMFYVGVHKMSNQSDEYLGSGNLLKSAISRYGKGAFKRRILFSCRNSQDAFEKERALLKKYVSDPLCYNLALGGPDRFYLAARIRGGIKGQRGLRLSGNRHSLKGLPRTAKQILIAKSRLSWMIERWRRKHHSAKTRKVMRFKKLGRLNNQYERSG